MSIPTLDNKTILVTGAVGFIGSNLVKRIYEEVPSATVIGIDSDRFACIELFLVHLQSNYRSYVVYDRPYWHCWHDSNFSAH